MTSFGKLGNDLMKVPRLEAGSTNWVVYKDRFLWSVDAWGLLEHVDGSPKESQYAQSSPGWSQERIPRAKTPEILFRLLTHQRRSGESRNGRPS